MRRAQILAGMAVLAFLVLTNSAFAVLIDDIQGTLGQTQWYDGSTDTFQTKSMGGGAADIEMLEFSTVNSPDTEYFLLAGSTFSITPSALIADQTSSNGGRAKGIFASGATFYLRTISHEKVSVQSS